MENYPSNSRGPQPPKEEPQAKKIDPVVTNEVIRRKKPLGKRFKETFMGGEDVSTVASYVFLQVLIPAAKDTISDALSQGLDRMLFGDSRSSSRSRGGRPGGPNGYVSYNRMSQNVAGRARSGLDEFARPPRRNVHDFDDVVLATRAEAEEVLQRLYDLVDEYQQATVADLLELVGVSGNHIDHKWGWTDVRSGGVTKVREGFLLDLPRPEPIS